MSDTPRTEKNYVDHDDLCVWWDNVGKEPLDYACTCGKWAPFLSASQSRVRKLERELENERRCFSVIRRLVREELQRAKERGE